MVNYSRQSYYLIPSMRKTGSGRHDFFCGRVSLAVAYGPLAVKAYNGFSIFVLYSKMCQKSNLCFPLSFVVLGPAPCELAELLFSLTLAATSRTGDCVNLILFSSPFSCYSCSYADVLFRMFFVMNLNSSSTGTGCWRARGFRTDGGLRRTGRFCGR